MNKTMTRVLISVGVLSMLVLAFASCGSSRKRMVGSQEVVEKMPAKTPKWVTVPFDEDKKNFYFKGEATDVNDSALGLRSAKANAIQNMVEAIRIRARSEFSEAVRGVNVSSGSLGRYLDSVVAWTTDNLPVSGIKPNAEYREKILVRTHSGVEYRYNCFIRLSISKDDYLLARKNAMEKAIATLEDEDARALALEAKERLWQ